MSRLRLDAPPALPLSLIAAAASGVLLWLALPPADLGPLGFVALVPLLWAVRGGRARRGALVGFVFGLAFYALLLGWLVPVTVLGWVALVVPLAGWYALMFAYVAAVWSDESPVRSALAVGAGWAIVEWLRDHWPFGGWSWAGLGYTPHDNPLLLPLASVIGALGLAFFLAATNAVVLAALLRLRRWPFVLGAAAVVSVLPVAIPVAAGEGESTEVAIVQGNVPEALGTDTRIITDRVVAQNHAELTIELAGDPPDLVVWPENALDRDPTRDPVLGPLVEETVRGVGAHALVGAITAAPDGRILNEDLLYDPAGRVVERYAKIHLLPFGEFVPLRRYLDWIPDISRVPRDLSPGERAGRFEAAGTPFAAVICFENAFADQVRRFVGREERFVVVSTNNSTFGRTAAPEQHLLISELRAVENGRWVVHAALSGISGVISPAGEVTQRTPLFEPALVRATVPEVAGRTIYNRIGGWLPLAFFLGALAVFVAPQRPRRREVRPLAEAPEVTVILPTFNERDNVAEALERLREAEPRITVTVVDDASPDGTARIVREVMGRDPRVHLIERPAKGGLASAYLEGFRRALDGGADVVVEMDADLSHRPEDLGRLLDGARRHQVVIGSRYVPGGEVRNWSAFRRALSRGGNWYARLLLGLPVHDATSGYRLFRGEVLAELISHPLRSDGYGFQIELAYRAWRRGFSVGEVPITFVERRAGKSKLSRRIVAEALWQVFVWGIRDRLLRRSPPYRPPPKRP